MRHNKAWRWGLASHAAVISIFIVCAVAGFSAQIRRPSGRTPAPAAARHPPFKAIFEPVSYAQDVEFADVFFIDRETGWACGHHRTDAGDRGVVIATHDGGRTWALQVGGPQSATPPITRLFFADGTHGWATRTDGTLLRTIDGATWDAIGVMNPLDPFVFTSAETGFALNGTSIQRTTDGGRTWRPAYECRVAVDVQGTQLCQPATIAFAPGGNTGFVVTQPTPGHSAAVIKTVDGGDTWTVSSRVPDVSEQTGGLVFTDPFTGLLRSGRTLKSTLDGGQTWNDVVAPVPAGDPKILMVGPVGWMIHGQDFSYTLDAGKRWNSRTIEFPSSVLSFSLPTPDTGYVVGSHGMVYRYRVVPFAYSVPKMLTIPALAGFVSGN